MTHILSAPRNLLYDTTDWKAGAWAGIWAGMVFMVLEVALAWLAQGQSPWAPLHRIAAVVMGNEALPVNDAWAMFELSVASTAVMVQLPASILLGMGGAWLLHRLGWAGGLLLGTGLGLALYVLNNYLLIPMLLPWLDSARNWSALISYLAFGFTLAVIYLATRKPKIPHNYLN